MPGKLLCFIQALGISYSLLLYVWVWNRIRITLNGIVQVHNSCMERAPAAAAAAQAAIAQDDLRTVLKLLKAGHKLDDWKGEAGACILHWPAHDGKLGTSYVLSQWYPRLVAHENRVKSTPFMAAINEHHLQLGDMLLQHYRHHFAFVEAFNKCLLHADKYGKTLLHYAAHNASEANAAESIEYLLKHAKTLTAAAACHGPEMLLRAVDGHGCTALHYAAAYGNARTLARLLSIAGEILYCLALAS